MAPRAPRSAALVIHDGGDSAPAFAGGSVPPEPPALAPPQPRPAAAALEGQPG